jgi:hypothetical protein
MSRRWLGLGLVSAVLCATAACGTPKLDRGYGKSVGVSINGTRVFFEMLKKRGHEVKRVSSFQNRFLDDANVVVWFEKDPDGVPWTTVEEAAGWLGARPGRSIVYVANDFDSDLDLWDDLAGHFHTSDQGELEVRARSYQAKITTALGAQAKGRTSRSWALYPFAFADAAPTASLAANLDPTTPLAHELGGAGRVYLKRHPSTVEPAPAAEPEADVEIEVQGEPDAEPRAEQPPRAPEADVQPPATSETDARDELIPPEAPGSKTLRELRDRIRSASDAVWLGADGRALVLARQVPVGDGQSSQVVLVHNGSFLLNYALVDPVHRTLAARLADRFGERQHVAFFEPANNGGRIWSPWGRLPPSGPSPIDVLFRPPLGWVFLHLLIVALLYLANQAPIFGRPRTDAENPGAPFTQHVRAYGKLLERTQDRAYVDTLLAEHERRSR